MGVDQLGIVTESRARAAFFAERYPSKARRIMGRPPVFIVDTPVVVPVAPPPVPEPPPAWRFAGDVQKVPFDRPTPALVIRAVGNAFEISRDELLGRWKPNRIARPRMACYRLIREFCRIGVPSRMLSMPEIGRIFRRDHTSVLSGLRRVDVLFDCCPDFLARYERARAELVQS